MSQSSSRDSRLLVVVTPRESAVETVAYGLREARDSQAESGAPIEVEVWVVAPNESRNASGTRRRIESVLSAFDGGQEHYTELAVVRFDADDLETRMRALVARIEGRDYSRIILDADSKFPVEQLRDRYGADLRWIANYNSETYDYHFHHIRNDLTNDLRGNQLDYVIHRSLAVYNKRHAEGIYFHLGESDYLLVEYERGAAFHIFLDDVRGVTIMLEPDVSVTLPDFVEACRDRIEPA